MRLAAWRSRRWPRRTTGRVRRRALGRLGVGDAEDVPGLVEGDALQVDPTAVRLRRRWAPGRAGPSRRVVHLARPRSPRSGRREVSDSGWVNRDSLSQGRVTSERHTPILCHGPQMAKDMPRLAWMFTNRVCPLGSKVAPANSSPNRMAPVGADHPVQRDVPQLSVGGQAPHELSPVLSSQHKRAPLARGDVVGEVERLGPGDWTTSLSRSDEMS